MRLFSRSVKRKIKEQTRADNARILRSPFNGLRSGFMRSPTTPLIRDTSLPLDEIRSLYYNNRAELCNGAFLAAPIVDGTADFIGVPECTFDDLELTTMINKWVSEFWTSQLWQIWRNALRDSGTWVRLRKPFPSPLLAQDEESAIFLEVIDLDRVSDYYDPVTGELIRVEIDSPVFIEDEVWTPATIQATGARAYGREHTIREIITRDTFYYYDVTLGEFLDFQSDNTWEIVPLVKVFNDYDSALHGGKSDLEQVSPFFKALHDLVVQTRNSHAYHADPKIKFKLDDVNNFLQNNFPDSFIDGKFTGRVNWKNSDVYFMESEEDAGFIEAKLSTNDSVSLMEFLIDCICMAGQVTEGILFRSKTEQTTANTDQFFRFKKKIERKRSNFTEYIQQIIKMATFVSTGQAWRPNISWSAIDIADLAAEGQAMTQIVTAAEVANRAQVISKNTYGQRIKKFFPGMLDPQAEQAQIQKEVQDEQNQQLDFEKKQAAIQPPNKPSGVNGASRNGNGRLTKIPLDLIPAQPGE